MTKQEERLERKKKKLSALASVVKLNEMDRKRAAKDDEPAKRKKKKVETETGSIQETVPPSEPVQTELPTVEADKPITDEQYKDLKRELVRRKDQLKSVPKLRLKLIGEKAQVNVVPDQKQPLVLDDIQNLLMVSLLKSSSPFTPWRWCHLEKVNKITHTVVLVIEGFSLAGYVAHRDEFNQLNRIFGDLKLELMMPTGDSKKIIENLACVPLTESYKERLLRQYGTLEAAVGANVDHKLVYRSVFPVQDSPQKTAIGVREDNEGEDEQLPDGDKFSRVQLLLSPLQMIDEDYPVPLRGELANRCKGYIMTQETYKPVTAKSPLFGLDCEMIKAVTNRHEVARVSLVNENFESVYETLVRPQLQIKDYLTPWSGITKEMMEDATKTLTEVQQDLRKILKPDAILVGQSLQFDLHALRMMHPYVIDTSVIYNISGDRIRKSKLQTLAKEFLGEDIQKAYTGHNSIEDSLASLKLAKLKLSNSPYFGDAILQRKRDMLEKKHHHTEKTPTDDTKSNQNGDGPVKNEVATTIFSHMAKKKKKSVIISTNNTKINYEEYFKREESEENPIHYHQVSSAKKAVAKTIELMLEHEFNLTHIKLKDVEDKQDKTVQNVDKWISRLWKSVALHGLFVVILADGTNSGMALVQIKNSTNCNFSSGEEIDDNKSDS